METKNLRSRLDQLRGSVRDEVLDYLYTSIRIIDFRTRKTTADLKSLQRIVAHLHDKVTALESEVSKNISQLQEIATRRLIRQERAWTDDGPIRSASHPSAEFNYKERLTEMLRINGQLKTAQKSIMLGNWMTKGGCRSTERLLWMTSDYLKRRLGLVAQGAYTEEDADELLVHARRFSHEIRAESGMTVDDGFELVINSIPDDLWLDFARTVLRMEEAEIEDIKCLCVPTPEQLFQLNREVEQWRQRNT